MVFGNIALESWSWEGAHLLIVTERQMPNYRVIWRIDVEAESAVAAAERALKVQRDPESIASLFEVVECPSPGAANRSFDTADSGRRMRGGHGSLKERRCVAQA
jgi:hypothetical protein